MRPIPLHRYDRIPGESNDRGAANLIEYIMISGVLLALLVVIMLLVNGTLMVGPAETITYSAFTDIGNGVSTRIVDTYAIAPETGNLSSNFDIPDAVAGQSYVVDISEDLSAQKVTIMRGNIVTSIAIAGIGSSKRAGGNTSGAGVNRISYDSGGFDDDFT